MVSIRDAVGGDIDRAVRKAVDKTGQAPAGRPPAAGAQRAARRDVREPARERREDVRIRALLKKLGRLSAEAATATPTLPVTAVTRRLNNVAAEALWLKRRDVAGAERVLASVDRIRKALVARADSTLPRRSTATARAAGAGVRVPAPRRELSEKATRAQKPYQPRPEKVERFVEDRPVGWSTTAWFTGGQ